MEPALKRGYAVAGTDMGHPATQGYDASWAYGHPEKLIDWAYRANKETAIAAKAIIQTLYGSSASQSYFVGCSDGGREGLMLAQRDPDIFQGIIAGAPANNFSALAVAHIWQANYMIDSGLDAEKLPALKNAAVAACDTADGVEDGIISKPQNCSFDPAVLQCPANEDRTDCLTPDQVEAVSNIYSGPSDQATLTSIAPGPFPGSEANWNFTLAAELRGGKGMTSPGAVGPDLFRNIVYGDQSWDPATIDYAKDYKAALTASSVLDANNANLDRFREFGGKLLMYQGLTDYAVYPQMTIDYYGRVATRLPGGIEEAASFSKLYLVPGMQHCFGGEGLLSFDLMTALENWVEGDQAPAELIATNVDVEYAANIMTETSGSYSRPLCPFPEVAEYSGSGDENLAANFACVAP